MRNKLVLLAMLLGPLAPASAQVSIGISLPSVSIGIHLPLYPELVPVPGYPVYYAPRLNSNYFFYDGMYWVFQSDNWYVSSWYNGPWGMVEPEYVPVYVLRIPVRYYRRAPDYFRGWHRDAPPRWDEHWGNDWSQRRSGWDRWNRNAVPARPPLPLYQRNYSGDRYPRVEQQRTLENRHYRYQVRDPLVRELRERSAPAPREMQNTPQERNREATPRANPPQPAQQRAPGSPRAQRPEPGQSAPPFQQQPSRQREVQPQQSPPRQREVQPRQQAPESRRQEAGPQGDGVPPDARQGQRPGQAKNRKTFEEEEQDRQDRRK